MKPIDTNGLVCTQCETLKVLGDFHKDLSKKYGVRSICKVCVARKRSSVASREYHRKYKQTDRYRMWQKSYDKMPRVKAKKKEYSKTKRYKELQHIYRGRPEAKLRMRAYSKEYMKNPLSKIAYANSRLKYKYGVGLEDYDSMLTKQLGGCAICGKHPSNSRLHIDHNHSTGKVRGLLCRKCNLALGLLADNPIIIKKMLQYILRDMP